VLVLMQGRQVPGGGPQHLGTGILDGTTPIWGVVYIFIAAAVSALASTLAERQMKDLHNTGRQRVGDRFYIHKFHLDAGTLLVSSAVWLLPSRQTYTSLDWDEAPLVLCALVQSWLAALVARHFSTVAKAVAQTMSVVVVYFAFARGPHHERHVLVGARFTFSLASVCLGLIVLASACVFQTGRINVLEIRSLGLTVRQSASEQGASERATASSSLGKYALLLLLIAADSARELTRQWALGGGSVIVFQSVTVMNSACSICIASIMAAMSEGRDGLKLAWDLRRIAKCLVVSLFFSLAATMGNMAYVFGITATVSTILGYFYMPISALAGRWVLGRSYMWLEWFALLIVTLSSIAYSMLETYAREDAPSAEAGSSSTLSMGMVLSSVCLSVLGSLLSEKILQGERLPFCIQKVHLEAGSLVTAVVVLFLMPFVTRRRLDRVWFDRPLDAECSAQSPACRQGPDFCAGAQCGCECGAGFLVGWNRRIALLLVLNILQGWIGGLVAKHTSTVHKGIAQCCSLLVIYAVGRTFMPQSSGPSSIAMTLVTLIVPLSVVLFQCASSEMEKVWKLRAEQSGAGAGPQAPGEATSPRARGQQVELAGSFSFKPATA